MNRWALQWSHGEGTVEASGAMLGPVTFTLPDGREIQPFAVFPWAGEELPADQQALQGLMANGRGEWPCVPFGGGAGPFEHPIHGAPAHGLWRRLDDGGDTAHLHLYFDCPPEGPLASVERFITGVVGKAEVECRLLVTVRRACDLPVGLHPTLRLPQRAGALRVEAGKFLFGLTLPSELEPGEDAVQAGAQFASLAAVPGRDGGTLDMGALPLTRDTESLLQLCGIDGQMAVSNLDEGYTFTLDWDAGQLPSCLLWVSNGGRKAWPWNGRNFALGIEPVCSYFDLGLDASTGRNPVADRGVATSVRIEPGTPFDITYRMAVSTTPAVRGQTPYGV